MKEEKAVLFSWRNSPAKIVKEIAPIVDGCSCGRPDMAQTAGPSQRTCSSFVL